MTPRLLSPGMLWALPALAAAATLALWARSHRVMDGLQFNDPSGRGRWSHTLHTRDGKLCYLYCGPVQSSPAGWKLLRGPQPPRFVAIVDRPRWRALGFGAGGGSTFWFVSVPLWFPLLLAALPVPALALLRRRQRRRRLERGLCPACGYDLRGTPGKCPECGSFAPVDTTG